MSDPTGRNLLEVSGLNVFYGKSQALFGLGYYHQRIEFFKKSEKSAPEETT